MFDVGRSSLKPSPYCKIKHVARKIRKSENLDSYAAQYKTLNFTGNYTAISLG